jgi:predicted short-subunit dehydrogenase-like oxidoreductase (DUF2520 family)
LALTRAKVGVKVCTRRPTSLPGGIECSTEPWSTVVSLADIVLVAVPDDAIADVARRLTDADLARAVVLHVSGLKDRSALAALEGRAKGLGSFHPLQTLAGDSEAAGRLSASFVALEGDAEAVAAGRRLAATLGMRPIEIEAARKPLYHAAAVILSNYTVALAAVAERLAREAGVPEDAAGRIYLPLLEGTLRNLELVGTGSALTGPIIRGDAGTVRAHLDALDPPTRELYRTLGREALALARASGLAEEKARQVASELER